MEEKKSLIHRLGDHAEISSTVIGSGFTYSLLYLTGRLENIQSRLQVSAIQSMFALAILWTYIFLKTCNTIKEPVLKNFLKLIFEAPLTLEKTRKFEKEGNIEGLIKLCEYNRRFWRYESGVDFQIGTLKIKDGKIEEGVEYFKRFFDDLVRGYSGPKIFELLANLTLRIKNVIKIRKNKKDVVPYFELIGINMKEGNLQKCCEYWERICSLDLKERIELNVLFSMFLDSLEKNKEVLRDAFEEDWAYFHHSRSFTSSKQWKKTIALILESEDLKFNKFPGVESRNEVLELGPHRSKFLQSTFAFKRGFGRKELRKDYFTTLFLYKLWETYLSKEKVKLARPLRFIDKFGNFSYYISRRESARNLEEIFNDATDKEKELLLREAVASTRKIHELSRESIQVNGGLYFDVQDDGKKERILLNRYDPREYLQRRLINRLGNGERAKEFVDVVYSESRPYLGLFESLVNGDLALPNALEGGVIIDFEKVVVGPPILDAVTLLEDPKNGNVNRKEIFRESYLAGVNAVEREFLEESYDVFGVFISACQVGSKVAQSRRKKEEDLEGAIKDMDRAKGFLRQVTKDSSPKVKDSFVKYIRGLDSSREEIKELQACL